jgi:hypothetical protein
VGAEERKERVEVEGWRMFVKAEGRKNVVESPDRKAS